jgi:hypothetical protein
MLGGWLLGAVARRVSNRTGVSDTEAYGSLPGDNLIAHPMVEWTRGITVRTTAERVWPSSAERLLPEYQHVAVGDIVCDGPNYASYFRVQHVDPPHALVYRSIRHPRRGSPMDINDPGSPSKIEKQLLTSGMYVDFTWALVLCELPEDETRLLVRTRANYSPPAFRLLCLPLGLVDQEGRGAASSRTGTPSTFGSNLSLDQCLGPMPKGCAGNITASRITPATNANSGGTDT